MDHIIKDIGNKVTCMVEELLFGTEMEKGMKETIILEKNKVMENITIIIINGIKECGKMENSMEKERFIKMDIEFIQDGGIMVTMIAWFQILHIIDVEIKIRFIDLILFSAINSYIISF